MSEVKFFTPYRGFLTRGSASVWGFSIDETIRTRVLSLRSPAALVLYAVCSVSAALLLGQNVLSSETIVVITLFLNAANLCVGLYAARFLLPRQKKQSLSDAAISWAAPGVEFRYYFIVLLFLFSVTLTNICLARETDNSFAALAVAVSILLLIFFVTSAVAYIMRKPVHDRTRTR